MRRSNPRESRLTIGLLIADFQASDNYQLWAGVNDVAREHGANLVSFVGKALRSPVEFDAQANVIYDLASSEALDGLVIWSGALSLYVDKEELTTFCARFSPLPMVSLSIAMEGVPSLLVDNYEGMKKAVEHLIEVHSRCRIAFIRGPETHPEAQARYRAYGDALAEHDIPFDYDLVTPGNFLKESGIEAIDLLLDERQVELDAVVASADNAAISAMEALHARGVRIPDDVAVAGFDDIEEGQYVAPPLTTVRQSMYEQGREAAEMLLALIASETVPKCVVRPADLVVRRSCGCRKPAAVPISVGPVGTVDEPIPVVLEDQREAILSEMAQVMVVPSDLVLYWLQRLLDAFIDEVRGESPDVFLSTLDNILCQVMVAREDVVSWHRALTVLQRYAAPCRADGKTLSLVSELCNRAHLMVSEAVQRAHAHWRVRKLEQDQALHNVSQALITSFDIASLAEVIFRDLPSVGIDRTYLSLYEDPQSPVGWSKLILAYDERGRIDLEEGGRRFPSRQLVPGDLLLHDVRYSLIAEPLYFGEEQIGFILFDGDIEEGIVYEEVRGQISSALKGALLLQRYRQTEETLRLSEENFQRMVTSVSDVLYSVDGETQEFVYLSPSIERMLGYRLEDIERMGGRSEFLRRVIEEEAFLKQERVFQKLRLQQVTEEPAWEAWWRHKDGSLICVEDRSIPIYEGERLVSVEGVLRDITERKRAEEEAQRRVAQAALLYEVGQRISSELELDALLSEIVTAVRDAFDYHNVMLLLMDNSASRLVLQAIAGGYADIFPDDLWLAVGKGMIGYAAQSGETQLSGDVDQDPHYVRKATEETRSELAVPIKSGQNVIGVLDLQSDQLDAFDETDVALMETLSAQIAVAIDNARLYETTQRQSERLAQTLALTELLHRGLELEQVLAYIAQGARRLGFNRVTLNVYHPEEELLKVHAVVGFDSHEREKLLRATYTWSAIQSLMQEQFQISRSYLIRQEKGDENEKFDGYAVGSDIKDRGSNYWHPDEVLLIPMWSTGGQPVGIVSVDEPVDGLLPDAKTIQMLEAFANQAAIAIENVRLLEDANSRARRLTVVNRIARAAGGTLHVDDLVVSVYQEVTSVFHADVFFLALCDEGTDGFDFRLGTEEGVRRPTSGLEIDEALSALIVARQEPLIIRNFEQEQDQLPVSVPWEEGRRTLSWLGVPMVVGERVRGVVNVQSYQSNIWDEEDELLLLTIADQVAVALEKARLFQKLVRHATELAIVNEIGQAIASAVEQEDLLSTVYQQVGRLFDTTNFYIAICEEEGGAWTIPFWVEGGRQCRPTDGRERGEVDLTDYVIRNRQPLLLQSCEEFEALRETTGIELGGLATCSWLGVPLVAADKVFGMMAIRDYERRKLYDEQDLALLSTLAAQVATALENLRLLEKTRRRAQEMETINDVARTISSVLDLDALLTEIVDVVKARFGHYFVGIGLLEGGKIIPRSASRIGDSDIRPGFDRLMEGLSKGRSGLTVKAASTGQPVLSNDVLNDPRYLPLPELPDTRSELSAPIKVKGRVIGVLDVQSDRASAYGQDDVDLLQFLASQAGVAIENARLFEQTQTRAQELAVLNELGQALTARLDVGEVMAEAYRGASRLIDTTNFYIGLYDAEKDEIQFSFDISESEIDRQITVISADQGLTGYVIRNRKGVLINQDFDERLAEMGVEVVGEPARSWIGVPLIVGERVLGVIGAQNFVEDHVYEEHDVELLTVIASQTAIAIQNARLYEQAQRDIRERERAERQLQRYAAELERSNEEVKQFAYIVSHDLRAPLVNLKGFSAELRTALEVINSALESTLPHLDEDQRQAVMWAIEEDVPEALDFIDSSISRMSHFTNAVLKLSRLGRRELKIEPIDMNALVEATLRTFAHQIEERQVQVKMDHLPQVMADRTSMEQIVGNILSNALKYLDPERPGEIEITAEQGYEVTTFHIRDNGQGIAQEDMDKVFMPFRRAGRRDVPGEGMGLAYVQILVRRHGGRIWCESAIGEGTTFSFTISNRLEEMDKMGDRDGFI